ncbi:hypothetical protein AU255_00990 [Methyloprofundus sedimenti]|uniref:DUF2357 domain-containing protein n=1 Tax=Methyloprofundus sedimenti TaxID=1420851 RepID=A0A1V8M4P6_9GAMM|nr:DUF2357 domain-containing protein [Methyloprofundus sedimenti]OQK16514.1 hypothetical protein AU255_00990 [Methyloprofundus sedimenti]
MPELLGLETPDWKLVVWSKDISQSQKMLNHTLSTRKTKPPNTCLRFDPLLHIVDLDSRESQYICSDKPLFFENKLYEFDFQFQERRFSGEPVIKHRLQAIEDAFHFSGNSLRGSLNFGNAVGWFKLELNYELNSRCIAQAISFEVFPIKMDIETDLSAIQQIIDKQYPLFRFSFAQKTEQELSRSRKPHERFPLLWLSQFESLRLELESGIKKILQAPHSRLLPRTKKLRAEQLKGRLSPKLEEQVRSALKNSESYRRYKLDTQILSVDTPENRFIKMVLVRCTRELSAFIARVKESDAAPENSRVSDTFFKQINHWKTPLERFLNRPFFKEIGSYEGLNGESLVLHQKAGYANVYRVWQQLKLYLYVFGQHASISMKSVAELYEVWCILEVRRLLIDELGFTETTNRKPALYKKNVEKALRDGMGAAFNLQRNGIKIRLAHEPPFNKPPDNPQMGHIYSWITSQKPDILLEAEFESGEKLRWIFDAKYRISADDNAVDFAPDDAINQMHRYRDALIHIHQANDGWQEKSRPIFGAFVLYPGWFEASESQNPYKQAIKEIGIGAFPLLPNSKNSWLGEFLVEQFGVIDNKLDDYKTGSADHLYVQESARISYTGMELSKFQDLTLTVALGKGRSKAYLEKFREGKAQWYHLPLKTTVAKRMQRTAMRELKYCAFVVYYPDDVQRRIEYVYELVSVQLVKRRDITAEQAGVPPKNSDDDYWLFELGRVNKMALAIDVSGTRDFKFRLANIDELIKAEAWTDLPNHYAFLQKA